MRMNVVGDRKGALELVGWRRELNLRLRAFDFAITAAIVAQFCACDAAHAQDVSAAPTINTAFDRTRTTAVADRIIAGYEPRGVTLGGFLLSPQLDAGVIAIDNVYVAQTNGVGDLSFEALPSFVLASQWSQNQLTLSGGEAVTRYVTHATENSNLAQIKAQGRYDIDPHLALYAYGEYRQSLVPRTQPGVLQGLKNPLFYNIADTGSRLTWTSNPVRIAVSYEYRSLDYDNISYSSGLVTPPAGLSRNQVTVTARAEYALTSDLALLVQAQGESLDYKQFAAFPIVDRSSHKHELLAGSSFEVTDFVRGEVALGFIEQQFDSPGYKNFSGFGGRAKIQFFPTGLTTAEFDLSRTLNEADNPLESSFAMTNATFKIDHELYRNVILTPSITYISDRFVQLDRTDTQLKLGFSVGWLFDHNLSLHAQYQYVHSNTNDLAAGLRFNVNVLSVILTYKI